MSDSLPKMNRRDLLALIVALSLGAAAWGWLAHRNEERQYAILDCMTYMSSEEYRRCAAKLLAEREKE